MTPIERVAAITCICGDAPVVLTIIDHRLGARADYCADCVPKHQATIERLRVALGEADALAADVEGAVKAAIKLLVKHDFVFHRAPSDVSRIAMMSDGARWEHMAFALYTDIAELSQRAEQYREDREALQAEATGEKEAK